MTTSFARVFLLAALGGTALFGAISDASAAIRTDDAAELFVVVWDPVKEVSYTKDLGLNVDTFFALGQSDAGFQQFWTLDAATDAAFAKLRSYGTASSLLQWAVLGFDNEGGPGAGELRGFYTLGQGPDDGTLNPNYEKMLAQSSGDWSQSPGAYANNLTALDTSNPYNFHGSDFAVNGSSFSAKGQLDYFANAPDLPYGGTAWNAPITNAVGKSSWFYYLTVAPDYDSLAPVTVDEFDNLGHDGYWGLAEDPSTHKFVLSYTILAATLTPAEATFARSIGRTERSTTFAVRKLAGEAASSLETSAGAVTRLAGIAAISPVPEPSSLGLFGLGLGVLAALQRRRTRR